MRSRFDRELVDTDRPLSAAELGTLGVTERMLRGSGWRRTTHGFWAPTRAELTPTQRILNATPLVSDGDAITGWASQFVHGVDQLDGLDPTTMQLLPVQIALSASARRKPAPGVTYLHSALPTSDVGRLCGLRLASPMRAAFDGVRLSRELAEAVAFADACAHAGMIDLETFRSYVSDHLGWKGVEQARSAADLADAAARSTWESRLRVFYVVTAGLPQPQVNRPVFDLEGKLLGIPDLLDEEAGLVTEFDGQDHRERRRHRADNVREESFESAGLVVCRADSLDLLRHRPSLKTRLRDGYRRGMRRGRAADRWTTTAPRWWLEDQDPTPRLTDAEKDELFGRW